MDFIEAMDYIEIKNKLGSIPGLVNIKELLNRLGNPQNDLLVMHIAGTNGKGSIFAYVESVLLEVGINVGRYISPTIFHYLERFQINTNYITENDFARLLTKIRICIEDMENDGYDSPTAFEIETALAFLYYKENNVDVALVECGMGGRLDATNVFDSVICSVISSISFDHMNYLGNTLQQITKEKMGIVKKNGLVISYPQKKEVEKVVVDISKELGALCQFVNMDDINIIDININRTIFMYKGKEYETSILGEHQVLNAATAIEVFRVVNKIDDEDIFKGKVHVKDKLKFIDYEAVFRGVFKATWAGRYTKIAEKPYFFVDGAHNEDGWNALVRNNNKYFTNNKIIYIIGVLKDKEYNRMKEILLPTAKIVITVTPDSNRALSGIELQKIISDAGVEAVYAPSIEESVKIAKSIAKNEDVIIACGSLSYIGEILKQN